KHSRGVARLHMQLAANPPGPEPDPGGDLPELRSLGMAAHRGVQPRGPADAPPPDQDQPIPVAGQPAAPDPEPPRADLAAETRPVVGVTGLPGPCGGAGMGQRP